MNIKRFMSAVFRRLDIPFLQSDDWVQLHTLRKKLGSYPRYQRGKIRFDNWDIEYLDAASFVSAFDTIVVQRQNDFTPKDDRPFILDCGANIGVSVIHYKRLFPSSKVIAFEPDKEVCSVLKRNLAANGVSDVEVVEAAIWRENGEIDFFSEGADAGRLDEADNDIEELIENSQKGSRTRVKTVRLADYLTAPVDFIKLDIEGAESTVLGDCSEHLKNVRAMVVEFHVTNSRPHELAVAMKALADAGFHVSINSYGNWVSLINKDNLKRNSVEFDQYLLLSSWR